MKLLKDPNHIIKTIAKHLDSSFRYLVAVSGGVDSMVLLCALSKLLPPENLILAHFDHKLRPDSADALQVILAYAETLGIPVVSGFPLSNPPKTNIEAWARKERYDFLKQARESANSDLILTAHHADDQVETLLLKLFSNRELRLIDLKCERRRLLRPFLNISKSAIVEFASMNNVPSIEDSSNQDLRFERNKIRNEIIPFVQKTLDRGEINQILYEQAERLDKLYTHVDQDSQAKIDKICAYEFGTKNWLSETRKTLLNLSQAKQEAIVGTLFLKRFNRRLGNKHIPLLASFILGNSAQIELPGSLKLIRSNGMLELKEAN